MNSHLYLIEVLIQEVCQHGQDIDKSEINVDVKLGPLNDINIQLGEKPDVFDVKLLNPGKSFLFPASSYVLKHQMLESEIKFIIKCNKDPDKIIGETTMKWPRSFRKLVERSNEKNLLPESITETLCFTNNCGHLKVFIRFSCLGNDIQTQYQAMQTRDEAMSYLFKGSKIPVVFQSPEYGKGGENDLLPVGPLFSTRDRGRKPSNYSLDITVSEIEANLCKQEDCLAAYKFKKYGIGPLAKEKKEIKSPCGKPDCKYAYEVGEPPCIGYRKCKYSTPKPEVYAMHVCGGISCLGKQSTTTSEPFSLQQPSKSARTCGNPNCSKASQHSDFVKSKDLILTLDSQNDQKCKDVSLSPNEPQTTPCPPIKKVEPKRFSCKKPCFPPKKNCCDDGYLRAGGIQESYSYNKKNKNYNTGDAMKTNNIQTCCGKPNCTNLNKYQNLNYEHNHNKKIQNKSYATICEECGGYSVSGKTCKDLKNSIVFDKATEMNDRDQIVENIKYSCTPRCNNSQLNVHTSSSKDNQNNSTKVIITKSGIIESSENSVIKNTNCQSVSQNSSYSKIKRLRSGATSLSTGQSLISQKLKLRKRRNNLVYNIGDKYPGHNYGHKTCIDIVPNVPWQKGWEWSPEPAVYPIKPRKAYRPGFISREIQNIINEAREAAGLPVVAGKPTKKKRKKFTGGRNIARDDDYDEGEEYEVEDKKTLYFNKKEGTYYIDLNPLRDPKHVNENEDPYINCPPIKFKYTEDPFKQAIKAYDACDCCVCDMDESEDEDLNLEFAPPRGVIEIDKMIKAPNVSHFWTQYDSADFIERKKN